MLRTASPVKAGRLQFTARRVLREGGAILEEAMFSCTGCVGCRTGTASGRWSGGASALGQQDEDDNALRA